MSFQYTFIKAMLLIIAVWFVLNPCSAMAANENSGSGSVGELLDKVKEAYSTKDAGILYGLCEFSGTDQQAIKKLYKGFIDDYQPFTISSMEIQRVNSAEERMYTSAGYKFNIPVVAKIRLFYEELMEKMSPAPIVYYYVGVKDDRYYINALVPAGENGAGADSPQADSSGDDDMIVIVPVGEE